MKRKDIEKEGFEFKSILQYKSIYHKKAVLYFMDTSGSKELTNIESIEFAHYFNHSRGVHLYIYLHYISNKPIYVIHDFGRRIGHISFTLTPEILRQSW